MQGDYCQVEGCEKKVAHPGEWVEYHKSVLDQAGDIQPLVVRVQMCSAHYEMIANKCIRNNEAIIVLSHSRRKEPRS
jgi:hypothetical protein